jgi:hypothetical protein
LRLARPEEADRVAELAETTGGPLDEYMYGAIERGTASTALLKHSTRAETPTGGGAGLGHWDGSQCEVIAFSRGRAVADPWTPGCNGLVLPGRRHSEGVGGRRKIIST